MDIQASGRSNGHCHRRSSRSRGRCRHLNRCDLFACNEKRSSRNPKLERDHCLEAYTDVLKTCATIHSEAAAAYISECQTEEHAKHARLIFAAIVELHGLVDRVLLLSPKEMYDYIRNLVSYCSEKVGGKSIECPKVSSTEWDAIQGAGYIEVYGDFTAAARNDLGIHRPHFTAKEWTKLTEDWKREKTI